MLRFVKVPYLGTAEEDVLLAEWRIAEGERFQKGQTVALVETLKATFEVEADADGVLHRALVAAGERAAMRSPLGIAGEPEEAYDEAAGAALLATLDEPARAADVDARDAQLAERESAQQPPLDHSSAARTGPTPSVPAARALAAEHRIDLEQLSGSGPDGIITLRDVERARTQPTRASAGDGHLDPAFVAHLRADATAFAALSSDFKVALYRQHGALLGADVQLGPGAVILAERLVLGDGCRLSRDSRIEAVDFESGDLLALGARSEIRCRRVRIGSNAYFATDVEVGGGGALDPEAELVVGSHGFVGEHVHLNPCRRLSLGDEVVVSRSAVLMTHSFGGSTLAGYPQRFAPVTVGDRCQIGIGAVLFPGVEIGAGSILLSGSSLVSSMPAGRLFGGVPALDMKAAARPLGPEAFVATARELVTEFGRQLGLRGLRVLIEPGAADQLDVIVLQGSARHELRFAPAPPDDRRNAPSSAEELRVCATYDDDAWNALPSDVAGFDLSVPRVHGPAGPLYDAFREFLRKRGVRLHPRTWTYPGGWL